MSKKISTQAKLMLYLTKLYIAKLQAEVMFFIQSLYYLRVINQIDYWTKNYEKK